MAAAGRAYAPVAVEGLKVSFPERGIGNENDDRILCALYGASAREFPGVTDYGGDRAVL